MGLSAQLLLHELPCPLCLLQRLQFTVLAIGPILNIRFGPRPGHYALAFARCAVWLVIGLTALNVVSTLVECGFRACADNPVVHELLQRGS